MRAPPIDGQVIADLVRQQVLALQTVRLSVVTGSMAPLIRPGDILRLCKSNFDGLCVGDIVLCEAAGRLYVHRFLGLRFDRASGQTWIIKRGDQLAETDRPFLSASLVGRAAAVERGERVIRLDRPLWRLWNRCVGWLSWLEVSAIQIGQRVRKRLLPGRSLGTYPLFVQVIRVPRRVLTYLLARLA